MRPAEADVRLLFDTMRRLRDPKVLVDCEVSLRASAMTFLYRTIVDGEEPERAYEAVAAVWSPQGPWKALSVAHLRQAGVAFVPYEPAGRGVALPARLRRASPRRARQSGQRNAAGDADDRAAMSTLTSIPGRPHA